MKELENKKELNEVEEEKVAGGIGEGVIFDPGTPFGPDQYPEQYKDIVTNPGNNLYPPLGRPLPFPQDRRATDPRQPVFPSFPELG